MSKIIAFRYHSVMALDLKYIESVNGVLSGSTWPRPDYTEGLYSLVQKIVKCLLTNPGDDAFDPNFGSGLRKQIIGLTGQDTDRAKQVLSGALQKVKTDLIDPSVVDPAEQIVDLQVRSMQYDPVGTSWNAEVDLVTAATTTTVPLTF